MYMKNKNTVYSCRADSSLKQFFIPQALLVLLLAPARMSCAPLPLECSSSPSVLCIRAPSVPPSAGRVRGRDPYLPPGSTIPL